MTWGLLGPDVLGEERRTRTLGLGRAVRSFNELAVPGLGGVWLGKHLFLSTLGVRVAQEARLRRKQVTNIEVANAIEALACWYGLRSIRELKPDPRLRGFRKLAGKEDVAFAKVRAAGFYVSQPMRMSVGQALPSLGLVDAGSSRFNTFSCTPAGEALIATQTAPYNPCYFKRDVVDYLTDWVCGDVTQPTKNLAPALSPSVSLSGDARAVVFERLRVGGSNESAQETQRRRAALAWVESLRESDAPGFSWADLPDKIGDLAHWQDLEAGALFFQTRDAALAVLDALERHIGESGSRPRYSLHGEVPAGVAPQLVRLRRAAHDYLDLDVPRAAAKDDSLRLQHADAMADASAFCRECLEPKDSVVLRKLVERDERVLHLKGWDVVPGPAFNRGNGGQGRDDEGNVGADTDEEAEVTSSTPSTRAPEWPDGLSYRVRNLFLLNADLLDEFDQWSDRAKENGENL